MRITLLAIPVFAVATAAFAASHAETTTYVDGNLNGVTPNSGATLTLADEKQMVLRTGLANITVPYENISHAELGAVKENSHDVPFYKVFAKRHKTETQLLIVNFKNDEGQEKTMTLELAQPAAASVYASIESHTSKNPAPTVETAEAAPAPERPRLSAAVSEPEADSKPAPVQQAKAKTKPEPKPQEMKTEELMRAGKEPAQWWGDDWWKTSRNAGKWTKPTGTNAPDQQ